MTSPEDLLRDLAQVAAEAATVVEPPEIAGVVESVTAAAQLVFGAAACSVALLDEENDELVYVASSGAGAREIVGTRLPVGRGIGGWVAQSGQAVAVSDLRTDPRFAQDVAESTHYLPTALMAVPIESGSRVLGVLTILDRDTARPHAERDMELATMFAVQAAAGIRAAETFRDIGSVLLRELARAAADGSALRQALTDAPAPASVTDSRYVALLAQLRSAGEAEAHLALRVIEDVLAYAHRKGGSSRPPR
jgi:GAF domain-containing protein